VGKRKETVGGYCYRRRRVGEEGNKFEGGREAGEQIRKKKQRPKEFGHTDRFCEQKKRRKSPDHN